MEEIKQTNDTKDKILWMYYTYSIKNGIMTIYEVLFDYNNCNCNVKDRATDDINAILYYYQEDDNILSADNIECLSERPCYIKTKNNIEFCFGLIPFVIQDYEPNKNVYIIRRNSGKYITYQLNAYCTYNDAWNYYCSIVGDQYFQTVSCTPDEQLKDVSMTPNKDNTGDCIKTTDESWHFKLLTICPEKFHKDIMFENEGDVYEIAQQWNTKRYEVTDCYDPEMPDTIGYADTIEEARKIKEQQFLDTDEECRVIIIDTYTQKEVL